MLTAVLLVLQAEAQREKWEAMMAQARSYTEQKEYDKAIQCNEELIAELKAHGGAGLAETIRDNNAIIYMYKAVPLLKEKKYAEAKVFFDKAVENAKPDGKTYYMAQSYLGQWYSLQSQDFRINQGSLEEAIVLSENAERHFNMANAPEKRLKEQVTRAGMLADLSRTTEAISLYNSVMEECNGNPGRDLIRAKALSNLGNVEQKLEDYQSAIAHLEEAYPLCMKDKDKTYALITALRLYNLYTYNIPDAEKAQLWGQRKEELEVITGRK